MGVTGCSALQLFISAQTHQTLVYDETDWDVMAELREVSDKLWELPQMEVLHLSLTTVTQRHQWITGSDAFQKKCEFKYEKIIYK